jgi:hypothetical protein
MTSYANPLVHVIRGWEYVLVAAQCDGCGAPSMGMAGASVSSYGYSANDLLEVFEQVADRGDATWLPVKAVGRDFEDVPEHVAAAAKEAYECADVGAWRASVLLARAVLEATAKDKDISAGPLIAKIDALHAQNLIREHIRDGAHEIRLLGNDMAHGDFVAPVTAEDGEFVLTLMSEVLEEVFQSPARVQRRRLAREARTQDP